MKGYTQILRIIFLLILLQGLVISHLFGAWGPDQRLTFNQGVKCTGYETSRNTWCIAADGNNLHVVWMDDRSDPLDYYEVYYKRSTDNGQAWSVDQRLTFTQATSKTRLPSVAVSGSYVHVVWSASVGGYASDIFYKHSVDNGVSWSDSIRLTNSPDTLDRYVADEPVVAAYGPYIYVVYTRGHAPLKQGNGPTVCFRRSYDFGSTWSTEVSLTNGLEWASKPSIAIAPVITPQYTPVHDKDPEIGICHESHLAHIVWTDSRHGNNEIYYQRISNLTTYPAIRLTQTEGSSWYPSIAVCGTKVHVVWEEETLTNGSKIFYKRSTNRGASWEPNASLVDMQQYTNALYPSLAVSRSNVHVIWENHENGNWLFYKKSTNSGASWQAETCLTADGYFWPNHASIAASGSNVHLVWTDYRDDNHEIYYKNNLGAGCMAGSSEANNGSGGVKSNTKQKLLALPNPFLSFARIPGYESESFFVYDVSGQHVGTYPGSKIGGDLSPGVYFVKSTSKDQTQIRIVKVH